MIYVGFWINGTSKIGFFHTNISMTMQLHKKVITRIVNQLKNIYIIIDSGDNWGDNKNSKSIKKNIYYYRLSWLIGEKMFPISQLTFQKPTLHPTVYAPRYGDLTPVWQSASLVQLFGLCLTRNSDSFPSWPSLQIWMQFVTASQTVWALINIKHVLNQLRNCVKWNVRLTISKNLNIPNITI